MGLHSAKSYKNHHWITCKGKTFACATFHDECHNEENIKEWLREEMEEHLEFDCEES